MQSVAANRQQTSLMTGRKAIKILDTMARVEGQLRRTGKRAAVRSRSWKGSLGTNENKDLSQEAYHGVPGSRTVRDSSDGYHGQSSLRR
jgi:hypothetical protein